MTRLDRHAVILGASSLAACASLGALPPVESGWTREELPLLSERCVSFKCPVTISRDVPGVEIRTEVEHLKPHHIPGWDVGTAGRVLGWISQEAIRAAGGTSDQTVIGIGSRSVVETRPDGWRVHCSVFWIDDQTVERVDGVDEITESRRRTAGMHCDAFEAGDTTRVRWRLRSGIAPTVDSLAAMYDSLVATKSDLISPDPPAVIEDVDPAGTVTAVLRITHDSRDGGLLGLLSRNRTITRSDGSLLARLHEGMQLVFDYAPAATAEERQILRLFGAASALPLR